MRSKVWGCLLSVAVSVLWTGCTAVSIGGPGGPGVHLTGISVTPTSADIPVGTNQQFTATGTFSDGGMSNLSAKATWISSDPTVATVDNVGLVKAVSQGKATISATLDSFNSSGALTVDPAALVSISVTPIGPGITVGEMQQFTATADYTDNSMVDVTAMASWSSSNGSVASITSGGALSGLAKGQSTISATFNTLTDTTAVNVVPPATAPGLNGNYAFSFTSDDASGPQFFFGTFHANGSGLIDSGVEDIDTTNGVTTNVSLTGSYTIYPDGRGTLVLSPAGMNSTTFRFILASSGKRGLVIQFDGLGTAAGSFEEQDSSAFNNGALNGNYVFRFNGVDSVFNPMGTVGLFVADGMGNITTGQEDQSDNGVVPPSPIALPPSSYQIASNGRGTVTLGTAMFAFYVVSAGKVNLIEIDSNPPLAGVAERQAAQSFSLASLLGGYAFLLNRAPAASRSRFDVIGRAILDGHGGVASGVQEEAAPTIVQNNITSGSYSVATNGRGVMQLTTANGSRSYIFYLVATNRFLMLDTFTTFAGTGPADSQLGTLDNTTLSGTYAMTGASIGQEDTEVSAWLSADGAGNLQGVEDQFAKGKPSSAVVSATYVVSPNGRTFVTPDPNFPLAVGDFIFYLVSSTQADMLGVQPALDGSVLMQ